MLTTGAPIAAIICAAGSSKRMGGRKKEYLALPSFSKENLLSTPLTVLGAAVSAFAALPQIKPIVITVPPGEESEARSRLPKELISENERIFFVSGGKTRRASVHNALLFLASHKPAYVLIHDGARPWIRRELIGEIIEGAIKYGAAIPALPLVETPKELKTSSGEVKFIERHLRRENLCAVQTPQGFAFPEILAAHEKAAEREAKEGFEYTDDAEVWGEFIGQVAVIPGDPENIKITYPEDLGVCRALPLSIKKMRKNIVFKHFLLCKLRKEPLNRRILRQTAAKFYKSDRLQETAAYGKTLVNTQRIGIGRDLHRLASGRKFLLGGVEIPFDKGELGHSDGDVLAHAVCDAILGAAGLGDIGELFPDSDPAYKDADSMKLLERAWQSVKAQGWQLANLDCVVCCENPKILPHRDSIRSSIAKALDADPATVFVKGKTAEGLGPIGSEEAVEAMAVCLLEKQPAYEQ
jgi:2-C-methyl-D-erythritol 2,4-cyclodiphosphate synthase/2-C-methyl-D-erythritol 4-phosphate cytidylyltransferase